MPEFEVLLYGMRWRVEAETKEDALKALYDSPVVQEFMPRTAAHTMSAEVEDVTDVPVGAGSEAD